MIWFMNKILLFLVINKKAVDNLSYQRLSFGDPLGI